MQQVLFCEESSFIIEVVFWDFLNFYDWQKCKERKKYGDVHRRQLSLQCFSETWKYANLVLFMANIKRGNLLRLSM